MSAGTWLAIDKVLGDLEVVLVPLSLVLLLAAIYLRRRKFTIGAVGLTIFLALTVAQPFGIEAVPISEGDFKAGNPHPVEVEAVHFTGPFGIPLFAFRPYTRDRFYINGESDYPDTDLKLRSWLPPILLTNATKVSPLCGATFEGCWEPSGSTPIVGEPREPNLKLFKAGHEYRYELLSFEGTPADSPSGRTGFYRLRVGIVSIAGLVYWLLIAFLVPVVLRRGRNRPDEAAPSAAGTRVRPTFRSRRPRTPRHRGGGLDI